jgi:hypothetical protein
MLSIIEVCFRIIYDMHVELRIQVDILYRFFVLKKLRGYNVNETPRLGKGSPIGASKDRDGTSRCMVCDDVQRRERKCASHGVHFMVRCTWCDFVKSGDSVVVMENDTTNVGTTDSVVVKHGQIRDYVGFKSRVNTEIKRLCAKRRAWASDESTELFVFIVDEYVAQLDSGETVDAGDFKELFARYVNQNAVNNRLADAGLIDRREKGSRKVGNDLI